MSGEKSCCQGQARGVFSGAFFEKCRLYRPLIVITLISLAGALALFWGGALSFMNGLMGLFLCFLASLKLFDLRGFATAFREYDWPARHLPFYAMLYPFVELGLGLAYLGNFWPIFTNSLLMIVMLVGSVGVVQVIRSGQTLQCACVGIGFTLPVGRVTLTENTAMFLMAAMNLVYIL